MFSIALLVGARRVLDRLGLSLTESLLGSVVLVLTPMFWWMQRWGPAVSAGTALLVWSFYLYLDDRRNVWQRSWHWLLLFLLASATNSYILVMVAGFFAATWLRLYVQRRTTLRRLLVAGFSIAILNVLAMYALGYFTVPAKWSQTGGYGWYSANLLGPIDQNGASRVIPDLPSVSGQHEPTSLATGVLVLMVTVFVERLRSKRSLRFGGILHEYASLILMLLGLLLIAITNSLSFGSWSITIPFPQRVEHVLSIFRSSARFIWPTLLVFSVLIIAKAVVRLRYASGLLAAVLIFQTVDYGPQFATVYREPYGTTASISYDTDFWESIPTGYKNIAVHPASNLGPGWAECAYAAVQSVRSGQCGYFGRVQGLEKVNSSQSEALFSGNLDASTIYWVSLVWLQENLSSLTRAYGLEDTRAFVDSNSQVAASGSVLIFPACGDHDECSSLEDGLETLGRFLRDL
jgi:hypothetical protein